MGALREDLLDQGIMPVHITGTDVRTEEMEPEHFVVSSFVIPSIASEEPGSSEGFVPLAILQLDPLRKEAEIIIQSLSVQEPDETTNSIIASGSVTSPASFATIASTTPPAGSYTVYITPTLSGTLAATDANNFRVVVGGVVIGPLICPEPGSQQNGPFVFTVNGAQSINVQAGAATPTTGAVYSAQINATPEVGTETPTQYGWLCHSEAQAQAQASSPNVNIGGLVVAGQSFNITGTAPLFCVGGPNANLIVSVISNRRGA
jgi:hypothetical protein